MATEKKVGIALLGAGIFATEAYLPVLLKSTSLELLAVYSRSHKSASALVSSIPGSPSITVYSDDDTSSNTLDTLLSQRSDIQAVIIALPITVQPEVIKKALKAGKHVLSEKPVSYDVSSAKELIAYYHNDLPKEVVGGVKPLWIVAENFGFEPAFLAVPSYLPKLGEIRHATVTLYGYTGKDSKWYQTPWRTHPAYQGGFLLDGGVHFASIFRTAFGSKGAVVEKVSAFTKLNQEWLEPVDTISAVLKLSDGTLGNLELSFGTETSPPIGSLLTILGSTGTLTLTSKDGVYTITVTPKDTKESPITKDYQGQGVEREVEEFTGAILSGSTDAILAKAAPEQVLKDLALIEGSLKSGATDGVPVLLSKL